MTEGRPHLKLCKSYEGGVENLSKIVENSEFVEKQKRIKKEVRRLNQIFADLDENKKKTCTALIERAAFITVSLQDLETQLNLTGWVETYRNGENQVGLKKSAAADAHISLTKNLNAIMKQLLELVPPAQKKGRLAEMMKR